ncbi:MAG TPA: hypothetical protein VJ246_03775 [Patescibacteria group bacterium]|nr:hypothetical protein [Patescibacteria group bacterium]
MLALLAQTEFFGKIEAPKALAVYGTSGGLVTFISNMIQLAVIVGGLIALFNVVMAGYTYLTSGGDAKAHEKVMGKLTSSLWGIVLMILAPAIMAIVGFLLFKDSTYFLTPKITGPSTTQPGGGGGGGGGGQKVM